MAHMHYVCLCIAINGLLADGTDNATSATDRQYLCDVSRTDIVNESYVANDVPGIDAIKQCQKLVHTKQLHSPAPRPCAFRVKITMTLIDLVTIDGIKGSIQIMLKYQEEWEDRRIVLPAQMNPECVDKSSLKTYIHLTPVEKYRDAIWTPDFYMKGMMGIHVSRVGLTAEDLILRSDYVLESALTLTLSLMCPMHFSKFPFDTHHCNITIESFGMFADELAIIWSEHSVRMSKSFTMGGYSITMLTSDPAFVVYKDFPFPRLAMTLSISRQRLRYILLVFVPCTLHFLIAWLAFFLPKEVSQGRCIINCTTNLSLISMLSVYMRHSPQGGHLKAFDVWVVFSMVFQFLCTVDSIIDIRLLYLAFNLRRQPQQPDTAGVVQLVTNEDNWLGREMRHVEPEIANTVVRSAVQEMRRLTSSRSLTVAHESRRRSSFAPSMHYMERRATRVPSITDGEETSYSSEAYQSFLRALVLYQEWSQWIYLGTYVFFALLYWYIYVPKRN